MTLTSIASFSLDAPAQQQGDMVIRRGKIFSAGAWSDKAYSMTSEELRAAAAAFTPCPVDLEHVATLLDGHLGHLQRVEVGQDGVSLFGDVALPRWLDDALSGAPLKVSAMWDRATKTLRGLSLVRHPHLSDSVLMAAFSAGGQAPDLKHGPLEPMSNARRRTMLQATPLGRAILAKEDAEARRGDRHGGPVVDPGPRTERLTPTRRRTLLGGGPIGRSILDAENRANRDQASEMAQSRSGGGGSSPAMFAASGPGGRHSAAVLASLTPNDFGDPDTLRHPIVDQQDVDDVGALDGSMWVTPQVRDQVVKICQRKGLDPPLAWMEPKEREMSSARRKALLGSTPMGRALLRDHARDADADARVQAARDATAGGRG